MLPIDEMIYSSSGCVWNLQKSIDRNNEVWFTAAGDNEKDNKRFVEIENFAEMIGLHAYHVPPQRQLTGVHTRSGVREDAIYHV